ncbi:hypothetical protein GCM10011611_17880 [Aliidongia dinghuensis]|uniref:Uncharacterized protein n=1 Tax=Aliidongia dinghuensis TaxID=1867774 RepID=A0A8J2YS30_9PROT|nr:hypothetical protein GCM10011611_17880 [Aliidongia dinghuensis]
MRAKVRARPPARFTALLGIGVVVSAIVMSNRSSIVPQSETLRSISPGINEIREIARSAAAAFDLERAVRLVCLLLFGVLSTLLSLSSLPRLVEMTGYLTVLAAAVKRSAAATVAQRPRRQAAAIMKGACTPPARGVEEGLLKRLNLARWVIRHRAYLVYSVIGVAVGTLLADQPEAVERTIGDFLEWLRQCYMPDLVYCSGVDEIYCSGWR